MSIGFRILPPPSARASADLAARFKLLPVANVSDMMNRLPGAGACLRPMHAGGTMAGPALTVRTRPGDNLMLHKALDMAEPGDVVVCDAGGDLSNALFGELMLAHAVRKRLAGLVIHGAIRDAGAIRAQRLPVFAAGVTHRGPYKDGPGEIGVPVVLGTMVVEPGDLMLGDDDGVLAIPLAEAETVYAAARAKHEAEEEQLEAIRENRADRSWVDAELRRRGVLK